MTTQHTDEMREAFEKAAQLEGLSVVRHATFAGDYRAMDTQWRWLGFKHGLIDATASAEAKYLPVVEKLVEDIEATVKSGSFDYLDKRIRDRLMNSLALAAPLLGGKQS